MGTRRRAWLHPGARAKREGPSGFSRRQTREAAARSPGVSRRQWREGGDREELAAGRRPAGARGWHSPSTQRDHEPQDQQCGQQDQRRQQPVGPRRVLPEVALCGRGRAGHSSRSRGGSGTQHRALPQGTPERQRALGRVPEGAVAAAQRRRPPRHAQHLEPMGGVLGGGHSPAAGR